MEASKLAVQCWDRHPKLQEMILMGPSVVNLVKHIKDSSGCVDAIAIDPLNELLRSMNQLLEMTAVILEHDFAFKGLSEFEESMTRLRFLIANVMDAKDAKNTPAGELSCTGCDSAEAFESLGKELPPPQSWFEENFQGMRGSTHKSHG
jgi:hypothetical protein